MEHWFFGSMSPDILEAAFATLGAFALGLVVSVLIGITGVKK